MKKILFGMMAAAVLATSCAKELQDVATGDATVTFTVGTPEIATRAYSDGATATVLQYAVYDAAGNELEKLTVRDAEIQGSTTVKLQLTTGNTYSVIFWAAAPNAPYTVDFKQKTMTVDYTAAVSNDEARDAFFKHHTFTVTGAQTETIELRRPFAQLNIGTADYAASTSAGYTPVKSAVTVKSIYNTLNLWDGAVDGETEVTYDYAEIAKNEAFPVAGYQYLAMNYLLVAADKDLVDIEFGYTETDATAAKTRIVGSVPVQRNYRTNIYGNLLTSQVDINVEIKPDYNEPAHELDALHKAALNGGEYTLTEDVELTSPLEVKSNLTLNLNGKTIRGNYHKNDGAIIKNYGTMTITGGTISSTGENGGSAVQNNGTMTINDVTLNGAPNANGSWPSYTVNNTGELTITDSKITSYHGAVASYGEGAIVNLNNSIIDMAGIPGFTSHGIYTYNSGRVIVNGGTYENKATDQAASGASVINGAVEVNSGNFSGRIENYYGTPVLKGGSFSVKPNANFIAAGFKAVMIDGRYYVIANDITVAASPEVVKDVFENGGSVMLADDIKFEKITSIEPGAEVYLNLNGKTITVEENTTSNTLMYVKEGAKLTIDGNGIIDLGNVSTMAIFAPYGELVINNGTFIRNEVKTVTKNTTGLFMGAKITSSNVTINGGYFDAGYYDENAADIEEILAGTKTFEETADDIAKRNNSKDANLVRVALKDNVSALLNHSGYGSFKVYGGTFVGANPAWGDEGCMLPTTPNYLRPWSYYQGALLDGQTFNENGIVLPAGYTITNGTTENGIPTYTVTYNK